MRRRHGHRSLYAAQLALEHAANAAAGVLDVAAIARDQVEVDVHARLSRGRADVGADVVAVRGILLLNLRPDLIEQREQGGLLRVAHLEEVRDVPLWNDDHVPATQGISLQTGVGERVFTDDVAGDAKLAAAHTWSWRNCSTSTSSRRSAPPARRRPRRGGAGCGTVLPIR